MTKTKSGYSESEVHHQEPGNKGDYSISEPHQDLLLTKSRWQKQKAVTQNQNFITENKGDYSVSEPHQQK